MLGKVKSAPWTSPASGRQVQAAISTKKRYDWEVIHRFSVSNYHSIREEVVLDLRIPGTAPDLPRFRRSAAKPDVRLPTVAVLMGPNGSGKTTLLKALTTMARVASDPSPSTEGSSIKAVVPFATERSVGAPTCFRLEVEADWLAPGETPQLFRYEFSVEREGPDFIAPAFHHELLQHFPRGRPRRLFERKGAGEPVRVSREVSEPLGLGSRDGRLNPIRDDAALLATLVLLNVPLAKRFGRWLGSLSLATNLLFSGAWTPPTRPVLDLIKSNPALMTWATKRLRSSDLGIRGVDIADMAGGDREDWERVLFHHRGLDGPLPLGMQSSGTKRLLHLLVQLHIAIDRGCPAVLDEIDADLHVDVVGDLFGEFHCRETNPGNAQLVVTSHNVGLLDDLEKEEVFIVEKSEDGATRVHGAQDVRGLRRDSRLYPKYRAGVLGGIPKMG